MSNLRKVSVKIDEDTYEKISNIVMQSDSNFSEVTRGLINKGLATGWVNENTDMIVHIVRQQLEAVMKPHIERLAKLSAKSGIMSATSTFLNVQAFQELVPKENRKAPIEMYDRARKKAAEYMRISTGDFNNDNY